MPNVSSLDNILRQALGQGVKPLASTFDVYRLSPTSTGQIISPENRVIRSYPARITHVLPTPLREQVVVYDMFYTAMCDPRRLQIGDVLVESGPPLGGSPDARLYALAAVQPLLAPVFARVEVVASMSRPNSALHGDEPLLGDGGYSGTNKFNEWVYTLNNGLYEVGSAGPAASIPLGLQEHRRPGPNQAYRYPTSTPRGEYDFYIPSLPGVAIQPGDYISDDMGNRFLVRVATHHSSGIQGWQGTAESVFV